MAFQQWMNKIWKFREVNTEDLITLILFKMMAFTNIPQMHVHVFVEDQCN